MIPVLDAAMTHVTDGSCAIDAGAHIGVWSRAMADRFTRVIACEPSLDTFAMLDANLLDVPHVERRQVAVGAVAGVVTMASTPAQAGNDQARYVVPGGFIPVETIDGWGLDALGLLKLDVEGSEYWALQGAAQTIRRCRPIVIHENRWLWTRHYGLPKHAVRDLLRGLGYVLLAQVERDCIWGPR